MDNDIKQQVEEALYRDPEVDPTDIAVAVRNGVVTLSGFVRSYKGKWQAEQDAKSVAGVAGVADALAVHLPELHQKSDPELARDTAVRLKHELPYAHRFMKLVVENGWIRLVGDVEWNYQKEGAEQALRREKGVIGINNELRVERWVEPADVKRRLR